MSLSGAGDREVVRSRSRSSRALTIASFWVVLGLVVLTRCDQVVWTSPGSRQVRVERRRDFDEPPLVCGLPTDSCRVFVGNFSSGYPFSWRWTGQGVDLCDDTIEPVTLEGKAAVLALRTGPRSPTGLPRVRLSLLGFTYLRPGVSGMGLTPFLGPTLTRCRCGILVVTAEDGVRNRTLMCLFLWNSPVAPTDRFVAPSRRQVGLLWPTAGGWGVWIWPWNGPSRQAAAHGVIRRPATPPR